MACRKDEPARRAFAISVTVSGSCLLNALSRPFLRQFSQNRGAMKPMSTPPSSITGFWNAGTTNPIRKNSDREADDRGPPRWRCTRTA